MSIKDIVNQLPEPMLKYIRMLLRINPFQNKYSMEMSFWKSRYTIDEGSFDNSQYRKIMLAMAGEKTEEFLSSKIVADFGCGPRGSLIWAKKASLRIGIDILADRYAEMFYDNILNHNMIYLKSTEKVIPLPSNFVDVMYTLNALDHVDSFPIMCEEILRVVKPGGEIIASFNIEEPISSCEPQRLNENIIKTYLLDHCKILSYRLSEPGPKHDLYLPLINGSEYYKEGNRGFLWVRAQKKVDRH